ncbi:response regulator [Pedobacter mucosus]|uniref:response regulator n=1 Tax=Pedobacter mucosus TaxID=2895286 RepID=UPI001EE3C5A2|nr:response regulator [Pedobacter mucosus]UKT64271.1 response regulator [Pedobacter mucosus]
MKKRIRLFIFDNDPEELWILREIFEASDFEVSTVSDMRNLFHKIVEFAPDVLLIDVQLNNYDGRTLCHHLRHTEATKDIPIIMMSPHDDLSPMDGVFCKADYMIKKPFKVSDVIQYIDTITSTNENQINGTN